MCTQKARRLDEKNGKLLLDSAKDGQQLASVLKCRRIRTRKKRLFDSLQAVSMM